MRNSSTWEAMTEAERDLARSKLRRAVGQHQRIRHMAPVADRRVMEAIEALLMDDRVILGGCLVMLLGIDADDMEDKAHYFLREICKEIDPIGCTDPQRN